jgi:hypothetical protein
VLKSSKASSLDRVRWTSPFGTLFSTYLHITYNCNYKNNLKGFLINVNGFKGAMAFKSHISAVLVSQQNRPNHLTLPSAFSTTAEEKESSIAG